MRKIILTLIALVVAMMGLVVTAGGASAHTPGHSENCSGVTVTGTNYEARDHNVLGVKIDGVLTEQNFERNGTLTLPIPQDGEQHTWSSFVHTSNQNPAYSKNFGPGTLVCGHKTQVTAASFTTTPASCKLGGRLNTPNQPEGVSVTPHPGTYGPGTYTIVYTAQHGFVLTNNPNATVVISKRVDKPSCHPIVKHATPHIKIVDLCRCKDDKVKVTGDHLDSVVVRQVKNEFTIHVSGAGSWLVPKYYSSSRGFYGKWVPNAIYKVHTTNKPCPCEIKHTCHKIRKHPPRHHEPCGCHRPNARP